MNTDQIEFLRTLEAVIEQRKIASADKSYTAELFAAGAARIAQKVGEEAVELAIASVSGDGRERILSEAADLVYHLLVLLTANDLRLSDVAVELQKRHR